MAGVNSGHRQRLRERMIKEGLDGFADHEILELLLFQYLPRKDTNKIAHNLLSKFGGFANVLNAAPEQLMTVDGVSQVTACNLSLLKEVWRRYKRDESKKINLGGVSSIMNYARVLIAESYVERFVAVYVDGGTNFLFSEDYDSDNIGSVNVDVKKMVATAVRLNASGVILYHCHVQGSVAPSEQDVKFTEKIYVALAVINVALLEHVIFNAEGAFYSFFKEGLMDAFAAKYAKL